MKVTIRGEGARRFGTGLILILSLVQMQIDIKTHAIMLLAYLFTTATLLIIGLGFKHLLHLRKWDHIPGYKSWSSFPLAGHAYLLRKPYQQACKT